MNKDSSNEVGLLTRNDRGLNQNGYTCLSVGERYPGMIPPMGAHLALTDTLNVVIRMNQPSAREVKEFRRMKAYGFYADDAFPHGILIWHFSDSLSFETPFNPRREETLRLNEVRAFLEGNANICQRVLLDEHGTVQAIGVLGMHWELVELLCKTWGDPDLDWSDYETRYEKLIEKASTPKLWANARKWTVTTHLSGANAGESDVETPQSIPCGTCETKNASLARLRNALKESESREGDQRLKITELQSHVASLAKDGAGLQARIASLSAGALQQEVAALKATIEEKEFLVLELEESIKCGDLKAKLLEGQIDDMGRRIKWLENRLREKGISLM